jgi:protein-S-isoprenylcysteine O-methyltransferase Ste14
MQASAFEFENRFWIIGFIFGFGFFLSSQETGNAVISVSHFAAAHIGWDGAAGDLLARILFFAGAIGAVCAAFIRTWATAYLKSTIVHDMAQHSEGLVADGPYRYVRNPLYLGNTLLAIGMGMLNSPIGFCFIVIGIWLFDLRLILREESGLRGEQGAPFERYLASVPRLLPTLAPRLAPSGATPQWGQAILAELFIWLFAGALLVFAASLNINLTLLLVGLSFPVYFGAIWIAKRLTV